MALFTTLSIVLCELFFNAACHCGKSLSVVLPRVVMLSVVAPFLCSDPVKKRFETDIKQISTKNSKEAKSHLFVCQIGPEAWGQFYKKITALGYKFL
jgi:hypothetical protein